MGDRAGLRRGPARASRSPSSLARSLLRLGDRHVFGELRIGFLSRHDSLSLLRSLCGRGLVLLTQLLAPLLRKPSPVN